MAASARHQHLAEHMRADGFDAWADDDLDVVKVRAVEFGFTLVFRFGPDRIHVVDAERLELARV